MTVDPNDFSGSDSERIEAAVAAAAMCGAKAVIPARVPDAVARRDYWLMDRAILLPGNTTLLLDNCRLKLSDGCRDNFIRSANCGVGINDIRPLRNIHIIGVGAVMLEGADNPRATGDSAKTLVGETVRPPPYKHESYGTDTGNAGENQKGDWRNIGILLAHVEDFSLQNVKLKDAHSWAVSLERCAHGKIRDLAFSADCGKMVDGRFQCFLNQDGLNLRQGCHDITIENITGHTGDDLIALTAIPMTGRRAGELTSSMVSGTEPQGERDDVHHIIIRNVIGYSAGHAAGAEPIRILNTSGIKMYAIVIDGVMDASPEGDRNYAVVRIGDSNPAWGGVTPLGDTYGFMISNIQSRAKHAIVIHGSLCDSVIHNVLNYNEECEPVTYASGKQHVRNVIVFNAITAAGARKHAQHLPAN